MDLQFFDIKLDSWRVDVSPGIWIFFAVSVPLTFLTVGAWKLNMWLKSRRRNREDVAKGDSSV